MKHRHPGRYKSRTPKGRVTYKRKPKHKITRKKNWGYPKTRDFPIEYPEDYIRVSGNRTCPITKAEVESGAAMHMSEIGEQDQAWR